MSHISLASAVRSSASLHLETLQSDGQGKPRKAGEACRRPPDRWLLENLLPASCILQPRSSHSETTPISGDHLEWAGSANPLHVTIATHTVSIANIETLSITFFVFFSLSHRKTLFLVYSALVSALLYPFLGRPSLLYSSSTRSLFGANLKESSTCFSDNIRIIPVMVRLAHTANYQSI